MIAIVHRDFHEAEGGAASVGASVGATVDRAPTSSTPAQPQPPPLSLPIHSWTYFDSTTRETCVVTLRSLHPRPWTSSPLRSGSGRGGDSEDGSEANGFVWELLYLPSDEPEAALSAGVAATPARAQFAFPHGALEDLVVHGSRSSGGGAAGAATDVAEVVLAAVAAVSERSSASAATRALVARDVVVFLSARQVLLYTGRHASPSVSLDYVWLPQAGASWKRAPAAVTLPHPLAREVGRGSPELLMLSVMPSKLNSTARTLVYLVSEASDDAQAHFALTGGVASLSSSPSPGDAAPCTVDLVDCVTDAAVSFTATAAAAAAATEAMRPAADASADGAPLQVTPTQCHWRLLDDRRLVGLLPMITTKNEPLPSSAGGAGSRSKNRSVVTAYAVPRLVGSVQGALSSIAVTLHSDVTPRHTGSGLGMAGEEDGWEDDAQELLTGDMEEWVERLTMDQSYLYCVPVGAAEGKPDAAATPLETRPIAMQFLLPALSSESTSARRQGLHTCAPHCTPSWATVLDKRRRKAAGNAVTALRVSPRGTVWAGGRPVLLADGDARRISAFSSAAAAAGAAPASPFEVVPTTAVVRGRAATAPAVRQNWGDDKEDEEAEEEVLCFPSQHAISHELRLSYVYMAATGTVTGSGGFTCCAPATAEEEADVSSPVSLAEFVESLLASALRAGADGEAGSLQTVSPPLPFSVSQSAQRAALGVVSSLWGVAAHREGSAALLTAVQQHQFDSSGVESFADYAQRVWQAVEATDSSKYPSSATAAASAAFAEYMLTALKELLVQTDWLLARGSPQESAYLDDMYTAVARLFLGGAGEDAVLTREVRCAILSAVWRAASRSDEGTDGATHGARDSRCVHWLRRMLLLHMCRRRHGAPLELLTEDIFTAAAGALPINHAEDPSTTTNRRDSTGMEVALLQGADEALLLANMPLLAAAAAGDGRRGGGGGGHLMLPDLCLLFGARECTCVGGSARPSSGFLALLGYAAALASSSTWSLSLGFAPMLLDVVSRLNATTASAAAAPGDYGSIIEEALARWQAVVPGQDGQQTTEDASSPPRASLPPVALPACLCRGVCWSAVSTFPWSAMPPTALLQWMCAMTDGIAAWESQRAQRDTSANGTDTKADEGDSDVWTRYLSRHAAELRHLRGGAHILRWLCHEEESIASDLFAAMASTAARADSSEGLTLADWHQLLTSRGVAQPPLAGEGVALPLPSSPLASPTAAAAAATAVGRVLHRCLAKSTGRLMRRLVSAGGPTPFPSPSSSSSSSPHADRTLAELYRSHGGAAAMPFVPAQAPPPPPLSPSAQRRGTLSVTPSTESSAQTALAPSPSRTSHDAAEALSQLAVEVWMFPFSSDPEAITNATLVEKLRDAFLWANQQQQGRRPQSQRGGVRAGGGGGDVAERLFAFLRVVFLRVYPQQLQLVEAELRVGEAGAMRSSSSSSGGGGGVGGAMSASHGGAAVNKPQRFPQYDTLLTQSATTVAAATPTMGAGELTESTRHTLSRLLDAFEDANLPMRCLAALFSIIPSAADAAERHAVALRSCGGDRSSGGSHARVPSSADEGDDADSVEEDEDEDEDWRGGDADDGAEGDGAGEERASSWFCLSPPTAYFVASQIMGKDLGRLVLAGELIRREMRAYVLHALFVRRLFVFDRRRGCLCGRPFDCRQLINNIADECELCSNALASCAPLYEPILVLLFLDVLEEQVVANGISRDDAPEARKSRPHAAAAPEESADSSAYSLYPQATVAAMQQCIAKAAQKTFLPLHAAEQARLVPLLRVDFRPYLEPTPAPALRAVTLAYELSAVHQRLTGVVAPRLRERTAQLRKRIAEHEAARHQSGSAAHLAAVTATATATAHVRPHHPSSHPPPPPPFEPFARERAAAVAVVAGLRNALGVPPFSSSPSSPSLGAGLSDRTAVAAAAAGASSSFPPSMSVQLLVREETARRKQLEATLSAQYLAFISSNAVEQALAVVYIALRHEARRRDLVRLIDEQRDIFATFEIIFRRGTSHARAREGHALARAVALRRAQALEDLWRTEAEERAALEAACYAEKSVMWSLASAQEECMIDESRARRQWVAMEADARAALADDCAEDRQEAQDRQADREEEEQWADMERDDAAQPPTAKNAFAQWQERRLRQVETPVGKVAPPRVKASAPAEGRGHTAAAAAQAEAVSPSMGLSRVVEAGEGLFGALSLLHSKLRDTVAPAPVAPPLAPPRQRGRERSAMGDVEEQEEEDGRAAQEEFKKGKGAAAAPHQPLPPDDGWGWEDTDDDSEHGVRPIPAAATTGAVLQHLEDEDGWGWSEEEEEAEGAEDSHLVTNKRGGAATAPAPVAIAAAAAAAAAAGVAEETREVVERQPIPLPVAAPGRKRKNRGLGAVEAIPSPPPERPQPPQQQAQSQPPASTEPAVALVRSGAEEADGWGWEDDEDVDINALQDAPAEAPPPTSRLSAESITSTSEDANGAIAADAALSSLPTQPQQRQRQPNPSTPDPARNIGEDIADAIEEDAQAAEPHQSAPAPNGSREDDDNINSASDADSSIHTVQAAREGVERTRSQLKDLMDLEADEDETRQSILLEEVLLYQYFKRSLILSYL